MRCQYCFYYGIDGHTNGIMSEETLELLVRRIFEYAGNDGRAHNVSLAFQGGEPTLAGIDFFRRATELTRKYNTLKHTVSFALQTNGLNVDDEMASFLAKERFLVGLSVDGTRDIHDMHRRDVAGRGTYSRVMRTAALLSKHGVEYNVLCVVSRAVAKHPTAVYRSLTGAGFRYLQFIPCLDRGGEGDYSLDAEEYGRFLCTVFDLWYDDLRHGREISVRDFDNLVMRAAGRPSEICTMRGVCGCYFTVESDGSVYPCDFYVDSEWKMGNISELSFSELIGGETATRFISESREHPSECRECRYYGFCGSGCRSQRDVDGTNLFCAAYRHFFDHSAERIFELARHFFGTV